MGCCVEGSPGELWSHCSMSPPCPASTSISPTRTSSPQTQNQRSHLCHPRPCCKVGGLPLHVQGDRDRGLGGRLPGLSWEPVFLATTCSLSSCQWSRGHGCFSREETHPLAVACAPARVLMPTQLSPGRWPLLGVWSLSERSLIVHSYNVEQMIPFRNLCDGGNLTAWQRETSDL